MSAKSVCCVCGQSESEMRPYGPNGAPICFPCAMKPENKAAAEREFIGRLDVASKDGVAVLTKDGPKPIGSDGGYALAATPAGKPEVIDHVGWVCTAHCHSCHTTMGITDDPAGVEALNAAGWRCTKDELFCERCAPSNAKPLEVKSN